MLRWSSFPLLFVAISLLLLPLAWGACRGNGCPKQEAAAKAHGLLGQGSSNGACVPQQYPKQGALLPVTTQGRILDIIWPLPADPPASTEPPKVVFALVADVDGFAGGPLWRSDYHGKADSWKDATPALAGALPPNETMVHPGVTSVLWHDSKPDKLLFVGRGRFHWVSEDAGATFKAVATPGGTLGFGQEIKTHPRQAEWLMAKVRREECRIDYRSPACGSDLFVSKDFGTSWRNLTDASAGKMTSVRDFEWGAKIELYANKPTPDEAVFATVYPGNAAHHGGLYPGWDKDLHYVITLDLFASPLAKIIPCGNLFEVVGGKVFLAVPSECPVGPDGKARKTGKGAMGSRTVTLYASDADGDDFVEVCLPVALEDDGYNIIHTHDDAAAFVLADHAEPGSWGPTSDSPTSDAYAPAYNVSLHTLSLPDIYRRDFITDFSRVEGLPGVYIANQVDPAGRGPSSRGREASFLRTRLSFNGGGSWQPIAPPSSFRFGHCNTCPPGADPQKCSLHLHGPTSWFAPEGPHPNFYSLPSAPGVVIASGNLGAHLDMSPDADCTWMSRDGGLSWEDVAENTAIYEIGNHGGLIVLSPHRSEGPTDTVTFSLDQGACFHKVQLPEAMLVDNIRVASGGNSPVFIVHGTACLKTAAHPECGFTGGNIPPGKMYSIDVQELLGGDWRECSVAEGSADYENWVAPKEGVCLLGVKRTLRRRNQNSFCVNPAGWDPSKTVAEEPCQCGVDDVECEFGFARDEQGNCTAIAGISEACPRLSANGYRMSSSHLRLVHGDQCTGVNDVIPDTNGKGGAKGSDSGGGSKGKHGGGSGGSSFIRSFFLFVLACGAVAVATGLAWAHCLSQPQKEAVVEKAAPLIGAAGAAFEMALGFIVEAYDWIRAKAQSLPFIGGRGGGGGFGGDAAGYEPLGSSVGLDLDDPGDYRSPALVQQGGVP